MDNLYKTLDGILLLEKLEEEIFKNYCNITNRKILELIENYWKENFVELTVNYLYNKIF
jgi:hypothetical protein